MYKCTCNLYQCIHLMTVVSGLESLVFIIYCFGGKPPVKRGVMPAVLRAKENSVCCSRGRVKRGDGFGSDQGAGSRNDQEPAGEG